MFVCKNMASQNSDQISEVDVTNLHNILNVGSKKHLEKCCRSIVIRQKDFIAFIRLAQAGILAPYNYACHFDHKAAPQLLPTKEELQSLANNGMKPFERLAKKASSKMFHLIEVRRCFSAHLFYTPCHSKWYLFYFDQRDQATIQNHWKHGSHIHLISNHWPDLQMTEIWQQVLDGKTNFPSAIHIRCSPHLAEANFR